MRVLGAFIACSKSSVLLCELSELLGWTSVGLRRFLRLSLGWSSGNDVTFLSSDWRAISVYTNRLVGLHSKCAGDLRPPRCPYVSFRVQYQGEPAQSTQVTHSQAAAAAIARGTGCPTTAP